VQLTHYNSKFKPKQFPVVLVCDNIRNSANIGSLFRTADAFGIEKLIFCGDDITLGKKMKKTSRSTEKYVAYEVEPSIEKVLHQLRESYRLIALEITTESSPLSTYKIQYKEPMALIIGNENFGLSKTVLDQCHDVLHIEMYGQNSSMNVVQATSIALYELCKQLKN
jgi:tRNA G18 (ribose-2'-O)-methylase SpoU